MRRAPVTLALLLVLTACADLRTDRPPGMPAADASARRILLTLPQQARSSIGLTGPPSRRYLQRRGYGPTPAVERTLNQLAREHRLERVEGWPIRSLGVYCEVFEVPAGVRLQEVMSQLMSDRRVDLVQRMNVFETLANRYDDEYADLQWALSRLGIGEAHRLATGRGVVVAVIDSAVDATHPELRGRIGIRRNLVGPGGEPGRGEVHGTAVAGIIASAANNRQGIVGIAPDARIAALRACRPLASGASGAQCTSFSLARALEIALGIDARVINLSLAGPHDPLLAQLLDEAHARGIVIVAAQHESGHTDKSFPTSHPKVIAAGATSASLGPSRYSLSAPAEEILSTTPDAGYAFFSGNSLAAAHISGVIALLMEHDPTVDVDRLATLLTDTTNYSSDATLISACRALERLAGTPVCAPDIDVAAGFRSPSRIPDGIAP